MCLCDVIEGLESDIATPFLPSMAMAMAVYGFYTPRILVLLVLQTDEIGVQEQLFILQASLHSKPCSPTWTSNPSINLLLCFSNSSFI